jgi:hypothetical protein
MLNYINLKKIKTKFTLNYIKYVKLFKNHFSALKHLFFQKKLLFILIYSEKFTEFFLTIIISYINLYKII